MTDMYCCWVFVHVIVLSSKCFIIRYRYGIRGAKFQYEFAYRFSQWLSYFIVAKKQVRCLPCFIRWIRFEHTRKSGQKTNFFFNVFPRVKSVLFFVLPQSLRQMKQKLFSTRHIHTSLPTTTKTARVISDERVYDFALGLRRFQQRKSHKNGVWCWRSKHLFVVFLFLWNSLRRWCWYVAALEMRFDFFHNH